MTDLVREWRKIALPGVQIGQPEFLYYQVSRTIADDPVAIQENKISIDCPNIKTIIC